MAKPKLHSRIIALADVTATDACAMYEIFARHYDCVFIEQFIRDLEEKDCVLTLRNEDGQICGFSTQQILRVIVEGKPIRAVFSGDTIVDSKYWGAQELSHCWCRYVSEVYAEEPDLPLYWFLISKGYRTYLYLPIFFEHFYPNFVGPTPEFEQQILDALSTSKFPGHYRQESGLIVFPHSHGQLKPRLAEIPPRRRQDPYVQYFLQRNPHYASGHELACLAEISPANMKRFAGRIMQSMQPVQPWLAGAD